MYLTLEDPHRFRRSRDVGCYLGLRPGRRNSGSSQPQLHISKEGHRYLRTLMVQGAHYILGPFGEDSDLRRWGLRLAERGGKNAKKRAIVAVARKLAVRTTAEQPQSGGRSSVGKGDYTAELNRQVQVTAANSRTLFRRKLPKQRSILRLQHLLKRERPTGTERKTVPKRCGWKDGDRGGSAQRQRTHVRKNKNRLDSHRPSHGTSSLFVECVSYGKHVK